MDIATILSENLATIEENSSDGNYYVYTFKGGIALNHQQVQPLQKMFQLHYCNIQKARNWGTMLKFDIVLSLVTFKINPENENEFSGLVRNLKRALYPTENNFDLYLEPEALLVNNFLE